MINEYYELCNKNYDMQESNNTIIFIIFYYES